MAASVAFCLILPPSSAWSFIRAQRVLACVPCRWIWAPAGIHVFWRLRHNPAPYAIATNKCLMGPEAETLSEGHRSLGARGAYQFYSNVSAEVGFPPLGLRDQKFA